MHTDHVVFIDGIDSQQKVVVTFASKEDDGAELVRTCAPIDFGPSPWMRNKADRYHFWDYDSDSPSGPHRLILVSDQIISIVGTDEEFDPGGFIDREGPYGWFYRRDWGTFS